MTAPSTWESLARADAKIARCHQCGDYMWDGSCCTCTIHAQRTARNEQTKNLKEKTL